MEKLLGFNETLWWLPLGRRMASWGWAMAMAWGRIPFILGHIVLALGGVLIWTVGSLDNPETLTGGAGIIFIPVLFYVFSFLMAVAGALVGSVAGFYAPMTEPENAFRSAFFQRLGWRTFLSWGYFNALCIPILVWVWEISGVLVPLGIFLGLETSLLGLCTCYAVNKTLRTGEKITVD